MRISQCPLFYSHCCVQSQESKYNAKVDAVKAEHQQLLQEAFEKAKVCKCVSNLLMT